MELETKSDNDSSIKKWANLICVFLVLLCIVLVAIAILVKPTYSEETQELSYIDKYNAPLSSPYVILESKKEKQYYKVEVNAWIYNNAKEIFPEESREYKIILEKLPFNPTIKYIEIDEERYKLSKKENYFTHR